MVAAIGENGQLALSNSLATLASRTGDRYLYIAVFADDGFSFNGNGLLFSNGTTRAATTTEASSGLVMTPGNVYNFALAYINYTTATVGNIQLLWRRSGGALEIVPREAIHARGRKDYYSFASAVVALKEGVNGPAPRTMTYLHGDHLGSISLTTNAAGQKISEQRYKPYGEVRWSIGPGMPTDKQFTSQTRLTVGYVGTLYDYASRAYDPVLGRFISADTMVASTLDSTALNRYMYVGGSPLGHTDSTGHCIDGASTLFCIAVLVLALMTSCEAPHGLVAMPSDRTDPLDGHVPVSTERDDTVIGSGTAYRQPPTVLPNGAPTGFPGQTGLGSDPGSGLNGYGQTGNVNQGDGGLGSALRLATGSLGPYPYYRGDTSGANSSYAEVIEATAKNVGLTAIREKFEPVVFKTYVGSQLRPGIMRIDARYLSSGAAYGSGEREAFLVLRGLSPDERYVVFDDPVDGLGKLELPVEFFVGRDYWRFEGEP